MSCNNNHFSTDFFEEHLEFIKLDQKDTVQIHQLKRQHVIERHDHREKSVTSYVAEPCYQIALCKKKCKKVLTGGESI